MKNSQEYTKSRLKRINESDKHSVEMIHIESQIGKNREMKKSIWHL